MKPPQFPQIDDCAHSRKRFLGSSSVVAGQAASRQETCSSFPKAGRTISTPWRRTNVPATKCRWNCYDRLISHADEDAAERARLITTNPKFKPELAEDIDCRRHVSGPSSCARTRRSRTARRHCQGRQMDRRRAGCGAFHFQMGAGSLDQPDQFVAVDDRTLPRRLHEEDRLTVPRSRRHRAVCTGIPNW